MVKRDILLQNANGLHMRPGRLFVQEAKKQPCNVSVSHKERSADAKSLVQLLKLGLGKGQTITLLCDGQNEQESLDHLETFLTSITE